MMKKQQLDLVKCPVLSNFLVYLVTSNSNHGIIIIRKWFVMEISSTLPPYILHPVTGSSSPALSNLFARLFTQISARDYSVYVSRVTPSVNCEMRPIVRPYCDVYSELHLQYYVADIHFVNNHLRIRFRSKQAMFDLHSWKWSGFKDKT